ncbi:MAG TPA: hybrid sensor histidine kinase/response regulator [Chromatiaceae bacterium]|jgi:signal transduction histidine kinase|nr:MAG: hypothetical protein N838_01440 [Thiohalocapsa sp. PB-PSB1]QQO55017.1 MAG: response regulator [Thiohalocapsa sp. PB-PSB1]HBG94156.1 hybrid sensor histidine kinase/response regulator [Chromatiaceae bacterium]HCS89938.1 hybrid sensor histidine kinase/response regulator [Chromatiaceae bacterium]
MAFPVSITRHLRELLIALTHPCLLHVAADYHVLDVIGDPLRYGLSLQQGEDAREQLPLLYGIALNQAEQWPMIELSDGLYADLLIQPTACGGAHLLLTDAASEHARRQASQQHANELQLLNRRLRRTLDELQSARAELEQTNQRLATLNQLKTQFIASLSHELRTPLTAILGHTELLRDQLRGIGGQRIAESLRAIDSGGAHLLSLINNVLDQASLETGQLVLNPAPTDLRALLTEIADMLRPMAEQRALAFRFQAPSQLPAWVETDATRLRQVILNLGGNAIKYTESGFVELNADWHDGRFRLHIRDTGPGIAPSERERILLPFQRGGQVAGQAGVGLGLAISQQILRLLGGKLVLEAHPEGGSVFGFEIPLERVDEVCTSAAADSTASSDQLQDSTARAMPLLLVDDAQDIRLLYRYLLEGLGFSVQEAADEQTALRLCRSHRFTLAIVDLHLGEGDGAQLIRHLRDAGFRGFIVGWSASSLRDDRESMFSAGADAYLVKPVPPSVLHKTLRDLLAESVR